MSRHHPNDISAILSAAETWQAECLIGDGSLFGVSETWTPKNVEALFNAYTPQADKGDQAFLEQLEVQLKGSGQAALLCAEILWVMYLFPAANHTKPERKRAIITTVASWSGTRIDPDHKLLGAPLQNGIGNPGSAYNERRWTELSYFIKVLRDCKSKASSERRNLLAFPWAFGRYLDEIAGDSKPLLSHMLRYLLFPDRFEPIFSRGDKRRIVAAFRQMPAKDTQSWSTTQLDRELLKIRKEQVAAHGTQALSFYQDPLLSMRKELEKAQMQKRAADLQANADVESVEATMPAEPAPPSPPDEPTPAKAPAAPPNLADPAPIALDEPTEDEFHDTVEFSDVVDPDSILTPSDAGEIVQPRDIVQDPEPDAQEDDGEGATLAADTQPRQDTQELPAAFPLNQIFSGAPGTGKTYLAMQRAVEICDGSAPADRAELMQRYRALESQQRIRFITLHKSYGYEDFVEGIRPDTDSTDHGPGQMTYTCKPGILKQMANLARHVGTQSGGSFRFDRSRTIWKMSLGNPPDEAKVFDAAIEGGFVTLGYGEGTDFANCTTREDVHKRLAKSQPGLAIADYSVSAMHYFCANMQPDDLVVIADGPARFRAIGRITGNYQHTNSELSYDYQQLRAVEWLAVYDPPLPYEKITTKQFSQRTLYKLDSTILHLDAMEQLASNKQPDTPENYVLIIDEINRGNIPKVFGELITLLEEDKREGAENELSAVLPYSNESFSVPPTLYLIGTMSDAAGKDANPMDPGLRRRFDFHELRPNAALIPGADNRGNITDDTGDKINLRGLLDALNTRIRQANHPNGLIGHSYFMPVRTVQQLQRVISQQVLPTLQACFQGDAAELASIIEEILPNVLEGTAAVRTQGSADALVKTDATIGRKDADAPGHIVQ